MSSMENNLNVPKNIIFIICLSIKGDNTRVQVGTGEITAENRTTYWSKDKRSTFQNHRELNHIFHFLNTVAY
jgi:hypothetical protein